MVSISVMFGQIGVGEERRGGGASKAEEHHDGLQSPRLPEHDRQHGGVHGEGDRAVADQAAGPMVLPEKISGRNSEPKQVSDCSHLVSDCSHLVSDCSHLVSDCSHLVS